MARPKLGDSESKRLQMVITEDEIEAIDEWQHNRRVASRSEAIRRLCQIGLRVEREIPELIGNTIDCVSFTGQILEDIRDKVKTDAADNNADDNFAEKAAALIKASIKNADRALHAQIKAQDHLFELLDEIAPLVNAEKFEDFSTALAEAKSARANVEHGEKVLNRIMQEKLKKADKS